MLTETESLLISLVEEQAEVIQRLCKALRFGLGEIQPGQPLTNKRRIEQELQDTFGVLRMLHPIIDSTPYESEVQAKIEKVTAFLKYSREIGTTE